MPFITVDCSSALGAVKPLHGLNNGPVGYGSLIDVSHYYSGLAIPYVRLHDPNWPHPREVDIPQVFPDFTADPDDPGSYVFGPTDDYIQRILRTGARIVYRLGVSIEHTKTKYYTAPPADFEKWAKICTGIIRHYTHGWADGMHGGVDYWEIWNEPDIGAGMWSGTFEDYLRLYEVTAHEIKALDPSLKVGGPAICDPCNHHTPQFLSYCRERGLPLDFFSWHTYTASLSQLVENAHHVRRLLDENGFTATESHLNEWNYADFSWGRVWAPQAEFHRREAFELQKNEVGASFVAAALIALQDAAVDVMTYYDGQPSALYCGLFDYYGCPQKTYHAFNAFRHMLDYPVRVDSCVNNADGALYSLAAVDPERGRVALLVSNFGGNGDGCEIAMQSLPVRQGATYRIQVLDKDRDLVPLEEGTLASPHATIRIALPRHSVAFITIGETATACA